jgi:hypothetical protein
LAFPLKRRSHEIRRCNSTVKLRIIPSFANLTRLDLCLQKPKEKKGILARFEFACALAGFKN